jgi:hypothetical protein
MSHFAQVIDGIVQEVIVAEQDFINTLLDSQNWIETSYNTRGNLHYPPGSNTPDKKAPTRGNFAGIGYIYDSINDVFYAPQPYPSWILNNATWTWEAPIPMPNDGNRYIWDEPTISWILDNTLATN